MFEVEIEDQSSTSIISEHEIIIKFDNNLFFNNIIFLN